MGLLGRARGLFKGLGTGAAHVHSVQYYSVVCPVGHRLRGQRTEGYQALRCPACGEGVFVLPASPLPEPIAPPRPARSRPVLGVRPVDEGPLELKDPGEVTVDIADPNSPANGPEIVWDESDADTGERAGAPTSDVSERTLPRDESRRTSRKTGEPSRTAPGARPGESARRASPQEARTRRREVGSPERTRDRSNISRSDEIAGLPGMEVGAVPRRRQSSRSMLRSPLIILTGVGLLVVGTVVLRSWRNYKRELPQVAQIGFAEGIPALKGGQFDKAYQLLSAAKEAVVALHDQVEHAGEIREAADQAAIYVNLLSDSLEAMLDEAARTTPQAWSTRFDNIYKGRSVIIDATISATPETSPRNRYELDYLVLTQGDGDPKERKAVIDLTGAEAITLAQPRKGDHVTFGACLESFQFDVDAGEWVIRLQPKSSVSMTYREALESLGWPRGTIVPEE